MGFGYGGGDEKVPMAVTSTKKKHFFLLYRGGSNCNLGEKKRPKLGHCGLGALMCVRTAVQKRQTNSAIIDNSKWPKP